MFVKETLPYNRRPDSESSDYSSHIGIEFQTPVKPLIIVSYYRQWQLPSHLSINNSGSQSQQKQRFLSFLSDIDKITKENNYLLTMSDTNIDTHPSASFQGRSYLDEFKDILYDFLDNHQMCILNKDYTRFSSHPGNSCIDHLITNIPNEMYNVTT